MKGVQEVNAQIRTKQNGLFQLSFNASLKVDFQGSRVTSDGGLILVSELDAGSLEPESCRLVLLGMASAPLGTAPPGIAP